ncbi:MAG: hypothetical protein Q4G69_08865 [Planctomycetia bacterium]|nr:hypothetical protein [Planctomycetia bacterium]
MVKYNSVKKTESGSTAEPDSGIISDGKGIVKLDLDLRDIDKPVYII